MHFASINNSTRLQCLHDYLMSGPKTTLQIQEHTGSMAPATDVSELRRNNIGVRCEYLRLTDDGRKIYLYSLE